MHLEILDERCIHLVRELAEIPETTCFYLAGGTALSLQLGLRKSYDFDFFAGMSYFEVADGEVLPETFIPADWERVKQFSRREQALLFEMESKRYDI